MGHWYDDKGVAQHKQPLAKPNDKGETERDTHLGDARKKGLFPSFSTINQIIEKPPVNQWRLGKMYEATGNTSSLDKDEVYAEFNRLTTSARDEGTRIHDLIEKAFKHDLFPQDQADYEIVTAALGAIKELKAPFVADFKTKGGKSNEEFEELRLFSDHYRQLAAYRRMILEQPFEPGFHSERTMVSLKHGYGGTVDTYELSAAGEVPACYIIYINPDNPGQTKIMQATEKNLDKGLREFDAIFECWKVLNNYDPMEKINV